MGNPGVVIDGTAVQNWPPSSGEVAVSKPRAAVNWGPPAPKTPRRARLAWLLISAAALMIASTGLGLVAYMQIGP